MRGKEGTRILIPLLYEIEEGVRAIMSQPQGSINGPVLIASRGYRSIPVLCRGSLQLSLGQIYFEEKKKGGRTNNDKGDNYVYGGSGIKRRLLESESRNRRSFVKIWGLGGIVENVKNMRESGKSKNFLFTNLLKLSTKI